MLGGPGAERLAEGLVVLVVQMGEEEEEKTGVVPRAEESTWCCGRGRQIKVWGHGRYRGWSWS